MGTISSIGGPRFPEDLRSGDVKYTDFITKAFGFLMRALYPCDLNVLNENKEKLIDLLKNALESAPPRSKEKDVLPQLITELSRPDFPSDKSAAFSVLDTLNKLVSSSVNYESNLPTLIALRNYSAFIASTEQKNFTERDAQSLQWRIQDIVNYTPFGAQHSQVLNNLGKAIQNFRQNFPYSSKEAIASSLKEFSARMAQIFEPFLNLKN